MTHTSPVAPPDPTGSRADRPTLKVVVIGGARIGSRLVTKLGEHGHEAIAASPDTITGAGLAEALRGASVVVDVSHSPLFEEAVLLRYLEPSTRNLLTAEYEAGVEHHVALSVVGADRLESAYMRARMAQESLIRNSSVHYSIVRATQFFETVRAIGDAGTEGTTVRVAPVLFQPIAADDVVTALGRTATGRPLDGVVEVAGPEEFRLDELVRRALAVHEDPRDVVADPRARYFGAAVEERTLLPGDGALLGATSLKEWLDRQAAQKELAPPHGRVPASSEVDLERVFAKEASP